MKKITLILGTATLFAVGSVAITGCGGSEQKTEETEQHEGMKGEMHEHEAGVMQADQHEGMEEEMEVMSDIEITQCPKWKDGEHKHTAHVCPMWDEEGESNKPGKCSKCGMKLVKFEDVKQKHEMQQHTEKEHDIGSYKH